MKYLYGPHPRTPASALKPVIRSIRSQNPLPVRIPERHADALLCIAVGDGPTIAL